MCPERTEILPSVLVASRRAKNYTLSVDYLTPGAKSGGGGSERPSGVGFKARNHAIGVCASRIAK